METPTIDFAQLERVSRRSLRMYKLTERERKICEVIIDYSFARARENAVIPQLQAFVDLTGLDKGDVSKALTLLDARGIVQQSGPRDARVYAFIPSAAFWRERKPLFDMERAIARAVELDRINELAPAVEPSGQAKLPLPADEPGLDEGMAMAARDDALLFTNVGESPIGKSPTTGGVGVLPTSKNTGGSSTRARGVTLEKNNESNVNNVAVGESPTGEGKTSFSDSEKRHIFEQLESVAGGPEFERYRPAWVNRVRNCPNAVREALGDLKLFRSNPRNKLHKPAGAWIFKRAKTIAAVAGKTFRMW
jgi:hypothetical protein